jgi:hypothetical protein
MSEVGPSRQEMLAIMQASGALNDLDISDEDFLGDHGRERLYVKAMQGAYALGRMRAIEEIEGVEP